jgi:hypothetical protein
MADRAVRAARTYLFFAAARAFFARRFTLSVFPPPSYFSSCKKSSSLKIVIPTEAAHGFIMSRAVEKSASLFPSRHVGRKK